MNLSEIPIRVEPNLAEEGLGGGVKALLHEVLTMLERLVSTGTEGAVDLRSLPMTPDDWQGLYAALGEGGVDAVFESNGRSRVRETAVPGVWWIEHRDADDNVVASFLEVTTVPPLLTTDLVDVRAGIPRLRAMLTQAGAQAPFHGGQYDG